MKNQQSAPKFTIRKLLGVLSLAVAITAVSPMAAHAQSDRPGNDMAHQERNPSQHPELFTGATRDAQTVQATEVLPARRTVRRNRTKVETKAIFVISQPRNLVAETADDVIGSGAPHQERNPSQHPELFVLSAKR